MTCVHRNITYRLIPGTVLRARKLASAAGACRWVWNQSLASNRDAYAEFKEGKGEKPSVTFFSLSKWFTELRHETSWLQELPAHPVRYVLKYQADAWRAAFLGGGFPKSKHTQHLSLIHI